MRRGGGADRLRRRHARPPAGADHPHPRRGPGRRDPRPAPRPPRRYSIDTGPPDGEAAERLADLGIDELSALAITHDELDHSGGLAGVLGEVEVNRLLAAYGPPRELPVPRLPAHDPPGSGVAIPARASARRGPLASPQPLQRPRTRTRPRSSSGSRIGDFDALLTADAEAEAATYGSGPVEFLKVAHHGSADAGLDSLLDRTSPELAAISVGADNTYGHPAPETTAALEGARRGRRCARTRRERSSSRSAGTAWGVASDLIGRRHVGTRR